MSSFRLSETNPSRPFCGFTYQCQKFGAHCRKGQKSPQPYKRPYLAWPGRSGPRSSLRFGKVWPSGGRSHGDIPVAAEADAIRPARQRIELPHFYRRLYIPFAALVGQLERQLFAVFEQPPSRHLTLDPSLTEFSRGKWSSLDTSNRQVTNTLCFQLTNIMDNTGCIVGSSLAS